MNDTDMSLQAPHIRGPLPGPLARALVESDEQYTSPSYTRVYPLAVARGKGCVIEDLDGNRFLDFTSGIAVCAAGHCHDDVTRAVQQQAAQLMHMSGTDFYYQPQRDLAKKLVELAPGSDAWRVFMTNSGAESVEAALKLARWHTGRQHVIAFYGAFHGRTLGALSLTASKAIQRRRFGALTPGVSHVEYPNPYRPPGGVSAENATAETLRQIENIFHRTATPDQVAAIVVEPIQGEGGYIVPPADFHEKLRELTQKHGILLVADEVQAGMGRTGKMFAMEHWGVTPDIICLAKGIASGMPLGAIVAREKVMDWPPGSHASTFGGNPVCCAAALATIKLLENGLMENAASVGQWLTTQLHRIEDDFPAIGEIRGKGLMVGVELIGDPQTREPAKKLRDELVQRCFHKGLLLLGCGESSIRFCPPLVVTQQQVDTAVGIFSNVLDEMQE